VPDEVLRLAVHAYELEGIPVDKGHADGVLKVFEVGDPPVV
jgi:hypothetical protein